MKQKNPTSTTPRTTFKHQQQQQHSTAAKSPQTTSTTRFGVRASSKTPPEIVNRVSPISSTRAKSVPPELKHNSKAKRSIMMKSIQEVESSHKGSTSSREVEETKVVSVAVVARPRRVEDIIDEYMIQVGQQSLHPGFLSLLHKLKTVIPRRRIATEIQDIKSDVRGIKERSERYGFQPSLEQGPSNSKWHDPRLAALYIEESEFVGFEEPRKRLIDWMVKGRDERTVVSVVGMGGQGKTTLAKKVFDSKDVVRHFDCHVWITVSQSYNVEVLLREMLTKLFKEEGANPPQNISQMDRGSLIDEVRNYLQEKRYVVMFDDVWDVHFWDAIEFPVIDNKNGSRILITTRNLDVVASCKRSSFVELLELQPLTQEQSLELFNKKAFQFDYGGCCPKELNDIAFEIVRKCKGLPLAIVAIGGVLSAKDKNVLEWQKFNENLSLELLKSTHLIGIQEILGLSYDDLPYHLKPCLLYFGIFPEDYIVRSKRVIRQWIAEGFVKEESGKTLEEVAEGYLIELIHRSLVQVSSLRIDGKVKRCGVHDLIREMILEKNEDLNFCKHVSDDGQSSLSGKFRRLSIATTYGFFPHNEGLPVRSLFFFENEEPNHRKRRIPTPTTYRLLKVLDYESATALLNVPKNLESLIHLKYLHLMHQHKVQKSIGMLQNLETLEVKGGIRALPKEITKFRKLRHLIIGEMSLILLKDGIGKMTSLQTLRYVDLGMDGVAEVIKELGKLKQLRDLGLVNVRPQDGSILSSSINEMCYLEKLSVSSSMTADNAYDVIDLHLISTPTMLCKLTLIGRLQKLPEWILKLQNLVQLKLMYSYFTIDPIKSLKSLQNLLMLSICFKPCFEELELHFEDGWFQKLKELHVGYVDEMRDTIIDKGALPSLKKLELMALYGLKSIPTGMEHLDKLEVLHISGQGPILRDLSIEDTILLKQLAPQVEVSSYPPRW